MELGNELSKENYGKFVEEYKEVGHELRYRDQFMATEFGFSMIAAGAALNAALNGRSAVEKLVIQGACLAFLLLLTLHLRNTNQDRLRALSRKEELRESLGFSAIHGNPDGSRRTSSTKWMIRFTGTLCLGWAVWTAFTIYGLNWRPISN